MIYLFEDRPARMNLYLKDKEALKAIAKGEVIRKTEFNNSDQTLDDYVRSEFNNAKVVLFHSTYRFPGGKITLADVKNAFVKLNAHFITFSGGSDLGNYFNDGKRFQGAINSGLMYENLPLLIESAKTGKRPDVRQLFFGKDFLKNEILFVKKMSANFLADFNTEQQLNADDLQEFKDRIIDTSLNDPELLDQKEKISNWLSDKVRVETRPTAKEVRGFINKTLK